jgi:hypothetical protein
MNARFIYILCDDLEFSASEAHQYTDHSYQSSATHQEATVIPVQPRAYENFIKETGNKYEHLLGGSDGNTRATAHNNRRSHPHDSCEDSFCCKCFNCLCFTSDATEENGCNEHTIECLIKLLCLLCTICGDDDD